LSTNFVTIDGVEVSIPHHRHQYEEDWDRELAEEAEANELSSAAAVAAEMLLEIQTASATAVAAAVAASSTAEAVSEAASEAGNY